MTKLMLVASLVFGLLASPAAADPAVLSAGHADVLDVVWAGGKLDVAVKDDTVDPPLRRDPADVILHAKPESALVIPEGLPPDYAFLGRAGDPIWILPQVENPDLLWPGWETEGVPAGLLRDDEMDFTLLEVDGPGRVHVYVDGVAGNPTILFDGSDDRPDTLAVSAHTHAHANWAFSATGLYTLWFEVAGTLRDGRRVTSGPLRYRFFVGDRANLPDLPETELTIAGRQPTYAVGDMVSLTAHQAPVTGLTDLEWSSRCGAGAFTPAGVGQRLRFTAAAGHHGCEFRVTLRGAGRAFVARSAPVTVAVRPRPSPPRRTQPVVPPPAVNAPAPTRRLALEASRMRLRGRTLRLRVNVSRRSTIRVWIRRGGRTVTRIRPRTLAAGSHSLELRVPRRLRPGRYAVQVRARDGSRLAKQTLRLQVNRPAARSSPRRR